MYNMFSTYNCCQFDNGITLLIQEIKGIKIILIDNIIRQFTIIIRICIHNHNTYCPICTKHIILIDLYTVYTLCIM